jgi:peptide/nickel transport system substrate-binding protein
MLESVETTDDYTVVFHFNSGSEVALNSFITNPICIAGPEWDELTDDQKSDWHYACGTGPYILTDYVADSYMTFTKNENYYDYDERYPENKLPYIDTINLIAISDTSNQLSQFIAGQLDMIGWSSLTLNDSEAKQIEAALDRSDFYVNTFYANAVGLQLKQCYEPFQNQKVRQAMQMAVDLETITTDYYGYSADSLQVFGLFDPTTSLSDVDNWSDEIKAGYTYDPEGAKALLAEAGYPDGFSFDVTLFAAQDSDLYTLVATQLAQVGITMNISIVSTPQEMQAVGAQLDNPACISGEICLSTILAANDTYTTGAAFNNMGLSDEKLDSMITAAKDSATMDDLVAAAHEIDDYAAEQHYTLQFSPKEQIKQYFSSKVKGYTGESIYTDWNAGTILPRLWVATEE